MIDLFTYISEFQRNQLLKYATTNRLIVHTLANPGWSIEFDLRNTLARSIQYGGPVLEESDTDWYFIRINDGIFEGSGDETKLDLLANRLIDIINTGKADLDLTELNSIIDPNEHITSWLASWYIEHCDGDWERMYGIRIESTIHNSWFIRIDITETEIQIKEPKQFSQQISKDNWLNYSINPLPFTAECDISKLPLLLNIFKSECILV